MHPEISYEMIDHHCNFSEDCFALTQGELASIIGAKRERVVKIIKELREKEIISTTRHHILILSLEKLEEYRSLLLQ